MTCHPTNQQPTPNSATEQIKMKNYNLIKKSKMNPTSLKTAIGAKCFECVGGSEKSMPDAGYINVIKDCASKGCPLLPYRPYQ